MQLVTCNGCLRIVLAGRFAAHLPHCRQQPLDPEVSSVEPSPDPETSDRDDDVTSGDSSSDEDFCGSLSRKRPASKGRGRGEGSPGARRKKQKLPPGKSKLSKVGGQRPGQGKAAASGGSGGQGGGFSGQLPTAAASGLPCELLPGLQVRDLGFRDRL